MKNLKKALAIVLTLCSLTAFLAAGAWAESTVIFVNPPSSMYIGGPTVSFDVKDTADPTESAWNIYTSDPAVTFTSDWDHTATIWLTAGSTASGSVTVTAVNTHTNASNSVTIKLLAPTTEATINGVDKVQVSSSASFTLSSSGSLNNVSWSVTNGTGEAYINNGTLTGISEGTVTVNASATNEINNTVSASKTVTITPAQTVTVQSVSIANPGKAYAGFSLQLTALVNGTPSTDVTWAVIDPVGAASITDAGVLTAASTAGGQQITVKATSTQDLSKSDTKVIPVSNPYVTITSSNGTTLASGQTTTLTATDYPNGTQTGWTWSFTDSTMANYAELTSNGSYQASLKIKAMGKNIIVQATDANSLSATITINTGSAPTETQFYVSEDSVSMTAGSTKQLYAYQDGTDITQYATWSSTANDVVTVVNGKLTAKKAGTATIIAYNDVGGSRYTDYCTVTVTGTAPLTAHVITYGNYSTFDGTNPLYFITNDSYYNFQAMAIDGYTLTNGNQFYLNSSTDGHILVALNPTFLKQLSSANYHTIQIASPNGIATGYFRTYGTSYNIYGVRTGDENNIGLWAALCGIGFIGAAAIIITKRKDILK